MNLVLDHPELRRQIAPMTLETYHALTEMGLVEERTELIEGYVLPKMSISPLHAFIVSELASILQSRLPASWLLRLENPLTLEFSEPEPDLAVVIGERRDFISYHPSTAELVIEVACSSLARDVTKAAIYARAGIREYWLVNPDERWIDLYTLPGGEGYSSRQRFAAGETLRSGVMEGLSVEPATLFA